MADFSKSTNEYSKKSRKRSQLKLHEGCWFINVSYFLPLELVLSSSGPVPTRCYSHLSLASLYTAQYITISLLKNYFVKYRRMKKQVT